MGQEPKKYHIADNGDIFKFNEDGSYTVIGNVAQKETNNSIRNGITKPTHSAALKSWLFSSFNWLYLLSLLTLVISGTLCIYYDCYYGDSAMLGMLSLCVGITAIVLPWIFKTISKGCVIILFLILTAALITIIVFSCEWLYTTQIALAFVSLFTVGVAYSKNIGQHKK